MNTIGSKPRVAQCDRKAAVYRDCDGISARSKQAWRIKKSIAGYPGQGEVPTVREQAEVGDEPSPPLLRSSRESDRNSDTEDGTGPKSDQRMRVRRVKAVWHPPWGEVVVGERRPRSQATDDVAAFVRDSHCDPRGGKQ